MAKLKEWYNPAEFSDLLKSKGVELAAQSVRVYLASGKIKGDKILGRWRISHKEYLRIMGGK